MCVSILRLLAFFAALSFSLNAQNFRPFEEGPVHEGFLNRITGSVALDAIPQAPPENITERIPPQNDPQEIWLNGYWAWSSEHEDFFWQSGVWRRPPPGRGWIPGYWKQFEEGWVWVKGFWSALPVQSLTYLQVAPPDQIEENPGEPPTDDFFWFTGYWVYTPQTNDYSWLEGHWEKLDPNWVLVPAHYLWREEGYVFIEPYWDWPIEEVGRCYGPIFIDARYRPGFIYEPVLILEPIVVVRRCFIYYPDYLCWYGHHYHYHPDFWWDYPSTPPWWQWNTWWCFSWHQHWGVWWWYGNPGYPAPAWMTIQLAQKIAPPHGNLIHWFKKIKAPIIVTPNGVVPPNNIIKSLDKISGKKKVKPIVPAGKGMLDKIKIDAEPKREKIKKIEPEGKAGPRQKGKVIQIGKPVLDPDEIKKVKKIGPVKEPPRPSKGIKPPVKLKDDKKVHPKIEEKKPIFRKPKDVQIKKDPVLKDKDSIDRTPKERRPIFKKQQDVQIKKDPAFQDTKDSIDRAPKERKPIFKKQQDAQIKKDLQESKDSMDRTPKNRPGQTDGKTLQQIKKNRNGSKDND